MTHSLEKAVDVQGLTATTEITEMSGISNSQVEDVIDNSKNIIDLLGNHIDVHVNSWDSTTMYDDAISIYSNELYYYLSDNKDITFQCTIDYPLTNPYTFSITLEGNDNLKELISQIVDAYKKVYSEEERTMTELIEYPHLINRGDSNGIYGIWGHEIGDLYIEGMFLDTSCNEILLYMGS